MKELGFRYRAFIHNIHYKEGYYKKVLMILLGLLIIDLMLLYLVW